VGHVQKYLLMVLPRFSRVCTKK